MGESTVDVELKERISALDALKAECLSVEGLTVSKQNRIFDNYKRAKLNLGTIYRIECSVSEDLSKNRESWLSSTSYQYHYSHFENYIEMMREAAGLFL